MKQSNFAQEIDKAMLTALKAGDRAAQEAVFRLFERPVYTLSVRICQCPEEALEVLQDTFILAFSKISQYNENAPFWAWLRQIAVNSCLGRLRKLRRREIRLINVEDAIRETPEHEIDLAGALAKLPVDTRTVVWLYDVEGYSHKEIAQMFGKSISFSKTQLSRAHARLRGLLEGKGGESLCAQAVIV